MNSLIATRLSPSRIGGLVFLVTANVALTTTCCFPPAFIRRIVGPELLLLAPQFLVLAQVALLALWLAWSDFSLLVRWVIGAVLFLSAARYAAWLSGGPSDAVYEIGVVGAVVLLAAHAVLVPLRWLCGWRLTFHEGPQAPARRGQFTLQHWFVWCACLAVPMALLALFPGEDTAEGTVFVGILLMFTAPLLASALLAAFSRRWWFWSLAAIGWTCPVGWGIAEVYWRYLLTQGGGFAGRHAMLLLLWVGMPAAVTMMLLVNLLLLRALGMRWVSVADPKAFKSSPLVAKAE